MIPAGGDWWGVWLGRSPIARRVVGWSPSVGEQYAHPLFATGGVVARPPAGLTPPDRLVHARTRDEAIREARRGE